jgi:hypothetical protein
MRRRQAGEDDAGSLRVFVFQETGQHLWRHGGELLPHGTTVEAPDLADQHISPLGRQHPPEQPLGGFHRTHDMAGSAHLLAELGERARHRVGIGATKPRHGAAHLQDLLVIKPLHHPLQPLLVERHHHDRRLPDRAHWRLGPVAHDAKLRTSEPAISSQPSISTKKISLNGKLTTTGGSIIMPMPISTEETTRSITRKGRNSRKPI